MNKYAIILAAGKGTRMKSDLPKCAYPFLGKPMVRYIVDECKKCNIENITVVVGFKKELLMDSLKDVTNVNYAEQKEQLGTGHAVLCAENYFVDKAGVCLIFPGDMPLIDENIINGLIDKHLLNNNAMTVVTTIMKDSNGYGRIYREDGNVVRIIEEKDANEEQKNIKEVNSGLYCVNIKYLFKALHQINNNNRANEYYLTDIIEIIGKNNKVDSYVVEESYKLTGINDLETLANTEKIYLEKRK